MSHLFQCVDCKTPGECLNDACRETSGHRCESCQRDAPQLRPSGDPLNETKWPTRIGKTPSSREA
jgi:hypothetical protein